MPNTRRPGGCSQSNSSARLGVVLPGAADLQFHQAAKCRAGLTAWIASAE